MAVYDPSFLAWSFAALVLSAIGWSILRELSSPLRSYPGPFLAKYTAVWRFYHTALGHIHIVNRRCHDQYGPVVRTGPNTLELDLPSLIKTIYSTDTKWRKTDFYKVSSSLADGKITYNLFSLRDPVEHARQKRPVAKMYSMAGVLALEPHVDDTIRLLCDQLERRYADGLKECNLGDWISFYAWDVIGQVTFSKHFGYLDSGKDFDGHIRLAGLGSDYLAACGQLPYLDRWIDKNPVYPIGGATVLLASSVQALTDRLKGRTVAGHDEDFLDRFIAAKETFPDVVDDAQIVGYLAINMLAGADTTAITIKAVFYYLLKNPASWHRLEKAVLEEKWDTMAPDNAQVKTVPFLEAVVREAMRLHPGVAMVLPRRVPEGEPLALPDGRVVPPGTEVGMNPYVVGRNREVWGEDADDFRPERWLRDERRGETEGQFAARLREMNNADLSLGAGTRVCLGRNLAMMEVYKVVATLTLRFQMELVHPEKQWWTRNGFFLRQDGLVVKLRDREHSS